MMASARRLGLALLRRTADIGVSENVPSGPSASTPTQAVALMSRKRACGLVPVWLASSAADLGPASTRSGIPSWARQETAPATCAPFSSCSMPTCGGGAWVCVVILSSPRFFSFGTVHHTCEPSQARNVCVVFAPPGGVRKRPFGCRRSVSSATLTLGLLQFCPSTGGNRDYFVEAVADRSMPSGLLPYCTIWTEQRWLLA